MDLKKFECICDRPSKLVHCWKCGNREEGRVRLKCRMHPKQWFLMDIDACPVCKSDHIVEVRTQLGPSQPHGQPPTDKTTAATTTNNNNYIHKYIMAKQH